MKVIRTIHPVGQGGFYTEIFRDGINDHCIVYDCGSENKQKLKSAIRSALPDNTPIDILFISHFDSDHVNGIKELIKHHTIKCVVMPQLKQFEWFYILEDCIKRGIKATDEHINNLRTAIQDIPIVEVEPSNTESESDQNEDTHFINLDENNGLRIIKSGTKLSNDWLGKISWIFMPINNWDALKISQLKKELENLLKPISGKTTIDWSNLSDEIIPMIDQHRQKINNIYKNIFGSANNGSMLLYSGLNDVNHQIHSHLFFNCYRCEHCLRWCGCHYIHLDKEACLYTGDANLLDGFQIHNLQKIVVNLIDRIGLMQIPHHGSIKNFSWQAYSKLSIEESVLFVSYGTRNRYGHPSTYLIGSLRGEELPIAEVTECNDTTLYQIIDI